MPKALFIFAHPDDETFTCGGVIALWSKQGYETQLICATRGEAGKCGDPPICTEEELGKVREQELEKAGKILGISQIFFLGMIDGTLDKIPQKTSKEKILNILKKEKPDIVVTFDKTGGTNHPDHIAIGQAATSAFQAYKHEAGKEAKLYHTVVPRSDLEKFEKAGLAYKDFGKMLGIPDEEITMTADISETYEDKVRALKCHKTQHKDWEQYFKRESIVDLKKEHFILM